MKTMQRRGSIRRFIIIWVSTLIFTCFAFAGVMLSLTEQLKSLTLEAVQEARGSAEAYRLQTAILEESREDMQYRLTRLENIRIDKSSALKQAREYMLDLPATAETDSEKALAKKVGNIFHLFYSASTSMNPLSIDEIHTLTDSLLNVVHAYRNMNALKMEGDIRRNIILRHNMQVFIITLILSITGIILVGSVLLVRRIITPTIGLSRAAYRFGQGDFDSRVEVLRDDELGDLCRTFNNMADDIARREKSRIEFTATVFHDIKNPLVIIGAAVRMIRKKSMNREKMEEWLDRVLREVDRLENLSQDLMDIVQVQSGQLSLLMTEIDFEEIVSRIFAEQRDTLTSHTIKYLGAGEYRILGDRRRLERVVINLLSNAVKYSPEGTVITMKLERSDSNILFRITDQGVGISEEEQKILFQPFGRLERTRDMARGTGLGLFIVKKIIEAHGGSVSVESSLGEGTTFVLSLPVV